MYQAHDLLKIQQRFSTELACRKYLQSRRWPKAFDCPRCGDTQAGYHRNRGLYQCKGCRYQVSLTAGTIFHKTRTPLRKWFWLILLMGHNKHGISMLEAQRLLGIGSYQTVWTMCHKIRSAMAHRDSRYKLAGLIELDDAEFGHRVLKGERRFKPHGPKTVRVAVSTRHGRPAFARLEVAEPASALSTKVWAQQTLAPAARLRTDGGLGFPALTELGHRHEPHPKMTPAEMDRWLPWASTITANLKRFIVGTHHLEAPRHLQRFLDEFSYRFNQRWFKGQLFDRLLTACATTGSVSYADLVG